MVKYNSLSTAVCDCLSTYLSVGSMMGKVFSQIIVVDD